MSKGISKITLKNVVPDFAQYAPKEGEPRVELMRVRGRIDKVHVTASTLDASKNSVRASGEFVATNCLTGEEFISNQLYPTGSGMSDLIEQAESGSMFALHLFFAYSARSVQKYAFDFQTALEMKPSEAVAQLAAAFPPMSLPAPKATEDKKAKK